MPTGEINSESGFAEVYAISLYNFVTSPSFEQNKQYFFTEIKNIFESLADSNVTLSKDINRKKSNQLKKDKKYYLPYGFKKGELGYEGMFIYAKICTENKDFKTAKKLFKILAKQPSHCAPQRMKNLRDKSLEILYNPKSFIGELNIEEKECKYVKLSDKELTKFKKYIS